MAKMLKLKFKKVLLKNKIKTNLTLLLLQKLITESFFEMTTTEKNFLKILFTKHISSKVNFSAQLGIQETITIDMF